MRAALSALLLIASAIAASAAEPEYRWVKAGTADAMDGQTIRFDGKVMRLWGLSAPALDQTCRRADGSAWPCGEWSRDQLAILIGSEPLKCFGVGAGPDIDGIELVRCRNERHNLNFSMLRFGAAVVLRSQCDDPSWLADERMAARHSLGLWSGSFEPPWQYRAKKAGGT